MGHAPRHMLRAALLGQGMAAIIAVTAITSTLLADRGLSAPTLQSSLNYLLLALVYLPLHLRSQGWAWSFRRKWWAYALLALVDVQGNYFLVLAYRYTSLTSVTLLDCFTIPMTVLLSAALLGATYRRGHYAGAAICVAGLALLVLTDRGSGGSGGAGGGGGGGISGAVLLGDSLVLLGASLYAVSNVLQEWLLGDVSVHELLGCLGAWGCLWGLAQGLPLELHTLLGASWTPAALLPFLGFGAAMFAFYSLIPYELQWGGAAMLNISLLASDLWAALARCLLFGGFQGNTGWFFLAAFLVVSCGITLFTLCGDVANSGGLDDDEGSGAERQGYSYQRVAAAERGRAVWHHPKGGPAPDPALAALEAVQRQRQALPDHAGAAGDNPFDVGGGTGGRGRSAGGFLPLATAEMDPWREGAARHTAALAASESPTIALAAVPPLERRPVAQDDSP